MKIASRLAAICAAASFCAPATGQSFNFSNFADVSPLTLNGSAIQSGNNLRLTNTSPSQTASVWYTTPVEVANGFEMTAQFLIAPNSTASEGIAFVIQNSADGAAALGGDLWGLGYGAGSNNGGIANSLAFEIDTHAQGFLNETTSNDLSINTAGALPNSENESAAIANVTPFFDMSDNTVHTLRILYVPGELFVYVDDLDDPLLQAPYTFEAGGVYTAGGAAPGMDLPNDLAWVGFTGSTGLGSQSQRAELVSWTWTSLSPPAPCYEGTVGDVLTINGSVGGFFRIVSTKTADPFTIEVGTPPGMATAPFALFGSFGAADGTQAVTLPIGEMCFGLDSPVNLGIGPAPAQFAVPPGIPLTVTLTLQGLINVDPSDSSQFGLTNAIVLDIAPGAAPTITSTNLASVPAGQDLTINGENFSDFATVTVGGIPATIQSQTSDQIIIVYPAGVPCDATLEVRNPDGQTATTTTNPTPLITNGINPTGSSAGGQLFIITGSGFAPGMTADFGGTNATVQTSSNTVVVIIVPPGSPGQVTVTITTPGGCSASTNYTYV